MVLVTTGSAVAFKAVQSKKNSTEEGLIEIPQRKSLALLREQRAERLEQMQAELDAMEVPEIIEAEPEAPHADLVETLINQVQYSTGKLAVPTMMDNFWTLTRHSHENCPPPGFP